MILTVSGRRIFPTLEFVIAGLNPSKTYSACFHLEQVDDKRLRFTNKCWQETLSTETRETPRKVWHQQGAQSGSEWMCRPITFDHVRITNKKSKEQGNASYIHLHTQHRYIPVLQIFECSPESSSLVSVTKIAHSQFITVTAYHV
uniref:T-box domain-containing protein n=1 Tax=Caenorhabditis japonica TaxID=281687 RepID=A0A8R1ENF6_CAEJA